MKKQLSFLLSMVIVGGLFLGSDSMVQAASTANGSYVKADTENNPIVSQNYGADPGVMVYDDTVYVYATNDSQELAGNNENTYGKINTLNCYSSTDMVNWTDHGSIAVAGGGGAAKWAKNSWAPCATHKKINGKEKFFLYFANNGSGIGVLTADSPTGPWTDPLGKALITGATPGCSGVTWMFDPAVFVDTDGTGYLYLGGGIPNNQYEHPKTARVIKLGGDMTSVQGSASTIDAPYLFEDSGINKIGDTYYYSYCSNWNCKNGFSNAAIEYMTSKSPMGPFTYAGEIMKNPGTYFQGSTGNNHHCIFEFKGEYYMAYHTRTVESKIIGKSLGYRTTHIDKLSVSNGKINPLTPSINGVNGSGNVNPYETVQAETIFTQAGITVTGDGNNAYVTNIDKGDYTKVKGVQFNNGLSNISVRVKSSSNGSVEVRDGSPTGTLLGTISVNNTNGSFKDFSGAMANVSGSKNICFVFKNKMDFDSWTAGNTSSQSGNAQPGQAAATTEINMLTTYGQKYGYSGTCINLYQLKDAATLELLKKNYNSITLENEMKPDALLGGSPKLISVNDAKSKGYYIPDGYKEAYVPQINFSTVDEVMKICYENGLHMRAHTLVWHSQTPSWFFRNNYNGGSSFVSPSVMDARMEMYIKTVMNHVCLSEYGGVVYAWDVVNEYFHAQNSGWESVYGKGYTSPEFVKKAFTYAHQTLSYFELTDSVKLFYNDYNTYMEVNDVIKMINFINGDGHVCDGVGMQSHLGTNYPSVDYYAAALQSFVDAGFEVQITEMDITNKGDSDLSNYAYNLYKKINTIKKNGGNISSVTWWGLSDQTTWIDNAAPLLFYTPTSAKPAYQKVMDAYTDVFGQPQGYTPNPIPTVPEKDPEPSQGGTESAEAAHIENGWYYLKNTLSQKYLTVEGDKADGWTNVCISTGTGVSGQKWYVTNTEDGYITLKSKLGNVMLDVSYGENEDGTNIGIYEGYSNDAQKYIVNKTDTDGVYTIATKASNGTKVIDVYNHETNDGTNVCQWTFWGNPNQQWQFEKVQGEPDPEAVSDEEVNSDPMNTEVESEDPANEEPTTEEPAVEEPTTEEPETPAEDPAAEEVEPTEPQNDEATNLTMEYSINSWGSGYNVSFKVKNTSDSAVD